jgi:hypothetical protein
MIGLGTRKGGFGTRPYVRNVFMASDNEGGRAGNLPGRV